MTPCAGSRRHRPGHVLIGPGGDRCWPCARDHQAATAPRERYSIGVELERSRLDPEDVAAQRALALELRGRGLSISKVAARLRLGYDTVKCLIETECAS